MLNGQMNIQGREERLKNRDSERELRERREHGARGKRRKREKREKREIEIERGKRERD